MRALPFAWHGTYLGEIESREDEMASNEAPITVERVTLVVNDLSAMAQFYRAVIGLEILEERTGSARLGVGGRVLLTLREDRSARRARRSEPGLFHIAFLLPRRADLGAFLVHLRASQVPLAGRADHAVSEALYFSDPEGNGIEVYWDKPQEVWPRENGGITLTNDPLDLEALAAEAHAPWSGAPEGTVVGHVHFQVARVADAEAFWTAAGLTLTHRYESASFFASGDYHHHVAANVWHSEGADIAPGARTGLEEVVLAANRGMPQAPRIAPGGVAVRVEPRG